MYALTIYPLLCFFPLTCSIHMMFQFYGEQHFHSYRYLHELNDWKFLSLFITFLPNLSRIIHVALSFLASSRAATFGEAAATTLLLNVI